MRQTLILNIVILGFFVLLFSSIQRRRSSDRLKLWIVAWMCAVAHFVLALFEPSWPLLSQAVTAGSHSALTLCGLFFIFSFPVPGRWRLRRFTTVGMAVSLVVLCTAVDFHLRLPLVSLGAVLLFHGLGIICLWRGNRERLAVAVPGTALLLLCCQLSSYELVSRSSNNALSLVLMELFAMYALLFANDFPRRSAGVWTTIAGLLAWAAVFPVGMLLQSRWPAVFVEPEIWNVPKVVVAFGMLVTLFEEELMLAARDREQYRTLFDGNPLPMWIFDKESTQLLEVNSAAASIFGWSREDLAELTINQLLSGRETSLVGLSEMNWKLAEDVAPERRESEREDGGQVRANSMRFETKSGEEVVVEVTLQRVNFQGKEARLLVAKDITAQVEAHEQLIHLAHHDALTGLPNRLLIHDRMRSAIATAKRRGTKAAILCLDLDRFKQINDTYGHAAGDSCLREIAQRLLGRLRSVDTAARVGGEEFMIILEDIGSLRDAESVASDLLFTLSAPHVFEGHRIHLSASVGTALFPDDGDDPSALWSMADAAMYRAKNSGGNVHRFYSRTT